MKAVHVYWFESSSGSAMHETLRYDDGSLSCSCPGWTRRVTAGVRTCKHVRIVKAGSGGMFAKTHGPLGDNAEPVPTPEGAPKPQRRFNFE